MTYESLLYEVDGPRARVTINRPDSRNSLSWTVMTELRTALATAKADPEVRVVVLTGAGDRAFCAGADLTGMASDAGYAALHDARGELARLFREMWELGKPIIARVRGYALAGGFGLACACDFIVCSDDSQFGTPEINVGLWPHMITVPLTRSMPPKKALELMMTGRRVDAREAERIGFVHSVVPPGELDDAVEQLATVLAGKSPAVMKLGRDSFYGVWDEAAADTLRLLHPLLTITASTEDASEGITAFIEKQSPVDGSLNHAGEIAQSLQAAVSATVRGKDHEVRMALVALLSGGHLLLEDIPGTGKTLLAKSLAATAGGRFRRVQCTPDLLPADITGTSVYRSGHDEWEFRPGPVFANVVLLDEVNRASPRTQSALLEPMEEHQVSVDGEARALPDPFFCIATQNPFGQSGTFPLPESQLDRFAISVSMGWPGRDAEREILRGEGGSDLLGKVQAVTTPEELAGAIAAIHEVFVAPALVEYVLDVAAATRSHPDVALGASPRSTLGILRAAQAHAVLVGRDHTTPDDVQSVAVGCLSHRILAAGGIDLHASRRVVSSVLSSVPVPVR